MIHHSGSEMRVLWKRDRKLSTKIVRPNIDSTTVKGQLLILFLTLVSLFTLETRGSNKTKEKNATSSRAKISSIVDANANFPCIRSKVHQFFLPMSK